MRSSFTSKRELVVHLATIHSRAEHMLADELGIPVDNSKLPARCYFGFALVVKGKKVYSREIFRGPMNYEMDTFLALDMGWGAEPAPIMRRSMFNRVDYEKHFFCQHYKIISFFSPNWMSLPIIKENMQGFLAHPANQII